MKTNCNQYAKMHFSYLYKINNLIHQNVLSQLLFTLLISDPDCCYYLHCPTFNYTVVPDPTNDRINAENYIKFKNNKALNSKVNLILSATYPKLQKPDKIMPIMHKLEKDFPKAFGWAGEINVIKHALVGNGFFKEDTSPRITKQFLDGGRLDPFFRYMEKAQWPVTIHCDCGKKTGSFYFTLQLYYGFVIRLYHAYNVYIHNTLGCACLFLITIGCDNYNAIPKGAFEHNPIKDCDVPQNEMTQAAQQYTFWRDLLGPFYPAFFYTRFHSEKNVNTPNFHSFRKVQHLHLMDTILRRYPRMKVVWAHMGLNKELLSLHPKVHCHIMETFFKRYPNLYVDISWDVLAKLLLLNYDEMEDSIEELSKDHSDIHTELEVWNRTHLEEVRNLNSADHISLHYP